MHRIATDRALGLFSSLPQGQAEAVLLRVVMGLDTVTAAKVLGKGPRSVRTQRTADCGSSPRSWSGSVLTCGTAVTATGAAATTPEDAERMLAGDLPWPPGLAAWRAAAQTPSHDHDLAGEAAAVTAISAPCKGRCAMRAWTTPGSTPWSARRSRNRRRRVKQFAVLYLALGVTFPFVALWLAALTDTGNWIRILGVICGVGLTASSGFFLRRGSTDEALPGEPTLTLVLLLWPARHVASEFAALCDPYVPHSTSGRTDPAIERQQFTSAYRVMRDYSA